MKGCAVLLVLVLKYVHVDGKALHGLKSSDGRNITESERGKPMQQEENTGVNLYPALHFKVGNMFIQNAKIVLGSNRRHRDEEWVQSGPARAPEDWITSDKDFITRLSGAEKPKGKTRGVIVTRG